MVASPSVAHFFGTKFHGVLFGTVMFFGALGGTLGPVIIGRLFDVYRSYDHAFALLIAFTLFGFLLRLDSRPCWDNPKILAAILDNP